MFVVGAIWDDGAWETWAILAAVIFGAYLFVMWCAALYWTYRDAASRSRDPVMQGIAVASVLVFNLPGLLLYLILRPKTTLTERYEHRLEAEALLHEIREQPACPQCRRRIETDFLACPYCRAALRVACEECGKALAFGWVTCPYCGADRTQPQQHTLRVPATPDAAALDANITPMAKPARPKRASTATYTPPAPKAAPEPAASGEALTEP
jgi:RNA polymerase subunit RPABC4/transcription elongation factor Spt4